MVNKKVAILANPSDGYLVGGAENQLFQLGLELAKKGHHIFFIGTIEFDSQDCSFDYIQIKENWARPKGWLKLFKVFRRINPNVLVTRVLNPLLPIYSILCQVLRIKLFYFCAHDWELASRPDKRISGWRWRFFWIGIQGVNTLFVQNKLQLVGFKKLLLFKKNRVVESRNLPSMEAVKTDEQLGTWFTWIGTYRPHKRPEWVLQMAKEQPQHNFRLIMDCKGKVDVQKEYEAADKAMKNFSFIPGVGRTELLEYYKDSCAILITSDGEGYPNVAIEGWSQGRAVLSTPNGALQDYGTKEGVYILKDLSAFIDFLRTITQTDLKTTGQNGLLYFKENFGKETILNGISRRF